MRRSSLSAALLSLLLPVAAAAQTLIPASGQVSGGGDTCDIATGAIHFGCIPMFVAYIIEFLFAFTSTVALIFMIWGGYQIAVGSLTGSNETGKKTFKNALIGLVVSLLSYAIINLVIDSITQ